MKSKDVLSDCYFCLAQNHCSKSKHDNNSGRVSWLKIILYTFFCKSNKPYTKPHVPTQSHCSRSKDKYIPGNVSKERAKDNFGFLLLQPRVSSYIMLNRLCQLEVVAQNLKTSTIQEYNFGCLLLQPRVFSNILPNRLCQLKVIAQNQRQLQSGKDLLAWQSGCLGCI